MTIDPTDKVKYIEEHGKVVCTANKATIDIKYYELNGEYYKIAYSEDKAVLVNKLSKDELQKILSCSDLDFGAW